MFVSKGCAACGNLTHRTPCPACGSFAICTSTVSAFKAVADGKLVMTWPKVTVEQLKAEGRWVEPYVPPVFGVVEKRRKR